jgi:hypothetical protein
VFPEHDAQVDIDASRYSPAGQKRHADFVGVEKVFSSHSTQLLFPPTLNSLAPHFAQIVSASTVHSTVCSEPTEQVEQASGSWAPSGQNEFKGQGVFIAGVTQYQPAGQTWHALSVIAPVTL